MTYSDRVWNAIKESINSCKYRPQILISMLIESGDAIKTTQQIIRNPNITYGFEKLRECNRLDLTLEAILLEEEWANLFTEDEKNIAGDRLAEVGYHVAGKDWTPEELAATVDAYIEMLNKESRNGPFVKAEYNKNLRKDKLQGRTSSAVEYRMQNISTVLADFGLPTINGYLPAKNIGEKNYRLIAKFLKERNIITEDFEPTSDSGIYEKRADSLLTNKSIVNKPMGSASPRSITTQVTVFERWPAVKAYVLSRSRGKCELCGGTPFAKDDGTPFLEIHHLQPLAQNGPDTVENTVALCPNCHRELHYGKEATAKTNRLKEKVINLLTL